MTATSSGCNFGKQADGQLCGDEVQHYRSQATEIDYPAVQTCAADELLTSLKPHTIRDKERTEVRDISLGEVIHLALMNSEVIRSAGTFLSTSNPLFTAPNETPSIYDPAIQESGVLFGNRGVEAALSDFDAQFSSQLLFSGGQQFTNTSPTVVTDNSGTWNSSLSKTFGNGGTVSVNHAVNYLNSNQPFNIVDSSYIGNLQFLYRQPMLAGAGTEFTRIAGPIARSFGGITGVSQGVLIARINNDITLNDFELSVRNLLLDVENAYWDLYLAYRQFDTAVVARNAALDAWRLSKKQAGEVVIPADEAQARNSYYTARSAAETAQSAIFSAETRLRRLVAMSVNEGVVLRPSDEPATAELIPDWKGSLSDALSKRVELRRQKWNIKSLELQLTAAKSLTRSRLDLVSGYQLNGFGSNLIDDSGSGPPPDGFYNSLFSGDESSWTTGVELTVPIGFRAALAQVRNYELRVAKAHKVLAAQELEIGHELATSFQELDRSYGTMRSNHLRFLAAEDDVRLREPRYRNGEELVDAILRAYERRAIAEATYYTSVVEYNKALIALELRRGTLMEHNNVSLTEGYWSPGAYMDAERQAILRADATYDDSIYHAPPAFSSEVPVDEIRLAPDGVSGDTVITPDIPQTPPPADAEDEAQPTEPAPIPPPAENEPTPAGE